MDSDYSVNSSELGSECDPELLLKMADHLPPVGYPGLSDDILQDCCFNMMGIVMPKSNDDLQTSDVSVIGYDKNQDGVLTQNIRWSTSPNIQSLNQMSVDEHLQNQLGTATQDGTSVPALPPEGFQLPMPKSNDDLPTSDMSVIGYNKNQDGVLTQSIGWSTSPNIQSLNQMSFNELLQNQLGTATQDETSVPALPPEELQLPMDSSYAAPDRYNFTGSYDFVVKPAAGSSKLYSSKDKTMYVRRNHKFSLLFSWDHSRTRRMYVRSTPVYQFIRDSTVRPETCDKHKTEIDETANHIIQSCSPHRSEGLNYCGDPLLPDSWFSIVHERTTSGIHDYKPVCSKTCLGGKPISVIYTLEDSDCNVVGRQTVKFNVSESACRDKRNKEAKSSKKRMSKEVPIRKIEKANLDKILGKSRILKKVMKKFKAVVKQIKRLG